MMLLSNAVDRQQKLLRKPAIIALYTCPKVCTLKLQSGSGLCFAKGFSVFYISIFMWCVDGDIKLSIDNVSFLPSYTTIGI